MAFLCSGVKASEDDLLVCEGLPVTQGREATAWEEKLRDSERGEDLPGIGEFPGKVEGEESSKG